MKLDFNDFSFFLGVIIALIGAFFLLPLPYFLVLVGVLLGVYGLLGARR